MTVAADSARGAIPISTLKAPALVGELDSLAHLPRSATARARTSLTALRIGCDALAEVARATPSLLIEVIGRMGREAEQIVLRRQRDDEMASAAVNQRAFLPKVADFVAETGLDVSAAMTPAIFSISSASRTAAVRRHHLRCAAAVGVGVAPVLRGSGGNAGARRLGALGRAVGAAHATVALSTVP